MKRTMRFFGLVALFAAMTMMTGCEKDNEQPENDVKYVTSTVTVGLESADASKELTDGDLLQRKFKVGDQVAVIYKSGSETKKALSTALTNDMITNDGKTATITVTMANPQSNGAVKLIYPASMAKETIATTADISSNDGIVDYDALYTGQDGTLASVGSLFDLAIYDGTLDGTNLPADPFMASQLAICKFTVKQNGSSINSTVTKLTVKIGDDIYSVNTSSLSDIWVAVKPVASGDIKLYAAVGKNLYTKNVRNKTLSANTPYRIGFTPTLVVGAVSGLFRVGNDLIYFSKGNLKYSGGSFSFQDNQYGKVFADNASSYTQGEELDLFTWGATGRNGVSPDNTDYSYYTGGNLSGDNDWGSCVTGSWRTPSSEEWQGVFEHTYGMATVNEVHGIILLPYNTTVTGFNTNHNGWDNNTLSTSEWATMEATGAVFLPAAGCRYGTSVYGVGLDGGYWSSTARGDYYAYYLYFSEDGAYPGIYYYRIYGYSVRLVGE